MIYACHAHLRRLTEKFQGLLPEEYIETVYQISCVLCSRCVCQLHMDGQAINNIAINVGYAAK